jgi:hypothetical protein
LNHKVKNCFFSKFAFTIQLVPRYSAVLEFDKLHNKCTRCWGRGVMKCVLCGGVGELSIPKVQKCTRCLGTCLEQCPMVGLCKLNQVDP